MREGSFVTNTFYDVLFVLIEMNIVFNIDINYKGMLITDQNPVIRICPLPEWISAAIVRPVSQNCPLYNRYCSFQRRPDNLSPWTKVSSIFLLTL